MKDKKMNINYIFKWIHIFQNSHLMVIKKNVDINVEKLTQKNSQLKNEYFLFVRITPRFSRYILYFSEISKTIYFFIGHYKTCF